MSGRLEFRIHGMDCAEEVAALRKELEPVVGDAERLSFEVLKGKMNVAAGTTAVEPELILQAVSRAGMRAEPWRDNPADAAPRSSWDRHGRTILTAVSAVSAAAGFAMQAASLGVLRVLASDGSADAGGLIGPLSVGLYAVSIIAGGWQVAPKAWYSIRRFRPDMNLLMTIAVIGAVAINQWLEASVVTVLFSLSLTLESWSIGRARRAVEALLAVAPPTAHVLQANGTDVEIWAADVVVGAHVVVRPGERIPLDGVVLAGNSTVNQAPITGESLPVDKGTGNLVFAGTVNGDGALTVQVTKRSSDTTLAQIIRMVGEAQSRRAPSERWVDQFARIYTPTILAIAVIVAVGAPLVVGGPPTAWLYRALVLLVIGCPCALVISTPVSIVASLTAAARGGVLIKGGAFVELPATIRAVALDKTGTLTAGVPTVVDVVTLGTHTETELLASLGSMESQSNHPLARAIVAHVKRVGVPFAAAQDVQSIQGRGATALISGQRFWVGSHRFLEERAQETFDVHTRIGELTATGRTVVLVGTEDHVCGFVTLADPLRPESAVAVRALRAAGVQRVVMLTGDNRATAERMGREAGVDEVHPELLPEDKVAIVATLVRDFGAVAMVGDGVNDAPAMGQATIGIAMGAAGSDAAIEAADIALMSDDLSRLPWLIHHSRRTRTILRQNVSLSLGIKVVVAGLTFAGHASLWGAIASDMGVSLVVIANALRLLRAHG